MYLELRQRMFTPKLLVAQQTTRLKVKSSEVMTLKALSVIIQQISMYMLIRAISIRREQRQILSLLRSPPAVTVKKEALKGKQILKSH